MNKWERKCKANCRELVMKPYCEACGKTNRILSQHHGLFKSSPRYKLNPFLRYDHTLQFCLCGDCHLYATSAPHFDQGQFEARMATKTPEKVKRLQEIKQGPLPPATDARFIDWEKVYGNLVKFGKPLGNEILAGLG